MKRALEVFLIFLRLGLISFGGPIAHLGYFRQEFVARRRWMDEAAYAQTVALSQFLPGPPPHSRRQRGGRGHPCSPRSTRPCGSTRPTRRSTWPSRWVRFSCCAPGRRRPGSPSSLRRSQAASSAADYSARLKNACTRGQTSRAACVDAPSTPRRKNACPSLGKTCSSKSFFSAVSV